MEKWLYVEFSSSPPPQKNKNKKVKANHERFTGDYQTAKLHGSIKNRT